MPSPADDSLDTITINTGDAACIDDGGILSHGRAFRVRDPSSVTGSERVLVATSAYSVDSCPVGHIALPTEPLSDATK